MPSPLTPEFNVRPPGPGVVRGWWDVDALQQTTEGHVYHLRGKAEMRGTDMVFRADEIDYDEDKAYLEARGHVFYQSYTQNEKIACDKVQYWVNEQRGYFTNPHGYAKNRVSVKPGILMSNTPFYFEGKFAERIHDRYILHNGFITGCKLPRPWWTLTGPNFDIYPSTTMPSLTARFSG